MMFKYSKYLSCLQYKKIIDFWWYRELMMKLDILEQNKIKVNIMELNKYLYDRVLYERGEISKFNDTKYNIENYMQIVKYIGYETDDEYESTSKQIDFNFINIMNGLSDKLEKFSLKY